MKKVIFFTVIILTIHSLKAQNAFQSGMAALQRGISFYENKDYTDALEFFKIAHSRDTGNAVIDYWLAKAYEETPEKENVLLYYLKSYARDPKAFPDILYEIGHAYQVNYKFDEAEKYFRQYKAELTDAMCEAMKSTMSKEQLKVAKRINECENGKIIYANYFNHKIKNIGDVINSEYPDYAPVITEDKKMMIFTSRRPINFTDKKDKDNMYFEDIWMSTRDKFGNWGKVKNMGPAINTEGHDACIALSPDGTELLIYRSVNGGDIFVSYFKDGVWTKPVDDIKGLNTKYKEPSATISANRKTIYFSSDRPGGYGGLDIYRIDQDKDGNWSEPVNLGSVINTEYDEDGPFIAPDGKTLYFSSNGHNNMGGYDVFSSKFNPKTKKWQEPVNLGFPINSPNDDIYFVIAGDRRTAYYASAKKNGFGDKDIYEIELDTTYITQPLYVVEMGTNAPANLIAIKEGHPDFTSPLPIKNDKVEVPKSKLESLPENTTLYTGIIKEENTQKGTEAHIFVKKLNATDKPREYFANKDGTFEIPLSHGYKYAIDIEKEGYLFSSNTIDLTKPSKTRQLVSENFELKKIQTGQKMVMKNIFYETGSASLKPESFAEIDVLFDFMVKNPTVKIEISGHTDNVGKPEVNMELSISRARVIYKILVNKGIDPSRIKFVGYGSDKPIASNDTPEGRSKNRRTEFEIIQ